MRFLLSISIVALVSVSWAGLTPTNPPAGVSLAWDPSSDLAGVSGYSVYYGVGPRTYTNKVEMGNVVVCTITNLVRGVTYYFAATAYRTNGGEYLESDFSNEVAYTPALPPSTPGNLRGTNVMIKVALESAPNPKGPWALFAELGSYSETPAFYRSAVSIFPPQPLAASEKESRSKLSKSVPAPPCPPGKI